MSAARTDPEQHDGLRGTLARSRCRGGGVRATLQKRRRIVLENGLAAFHMRRSGSSFAGCNGRSACEAVLSCSCTKQGAHAPLSHLPRPSPPPKFVERGSGPEGRRSPFASLALPGPALGRPEDGGNKTGPWGGFRTVRGNSRPLSHGGVQEANYGSMASPHPRGLCHEGRRSCVADADLFVVSPSVMLGLH